MLRWLKYSLVLLVGCSFLGMIVYALWMRDEIRSAQMEPPLIAAPDVPVKRRPEEPGGMEIPNRDKLVFDLLDGTASDTLAVTSPEEVVEDHAAAPLAATPRLTASPTTTVEQAPMNPVADQLALARLAAETVSASPVTAPQTPVKEQAKTKATVAVSATVPAAKAVAETPAAKPAPDTEVKKGGQWGVQVGAVNTESDATTLAVTLKGKYPALKGLVAHTSKVNSGSGTRYRVQFVGLKDRTSAGKVCAQLGGKQPCFPISL